MQGLAMRFLGGPVILNEANPFARECVGGGEGSLASQSLSADREELFERWASAASRGPSTTWMPRFARHPLRSG